MNNYREFLQSKVHLTDSVGKQINKNEVNTILFEFQKDIVVWATKKGRAAVFLDTGMGKTFIQLEWARLLGENTLIIAPLSVARQTIREAVKIDIEISYVRSDEDMSGHSIWITNYENISKFDFSQFGAVVLDESSILKAIGGKTRRLLTRLCSDVPYRLACTATPAPNDNIEIGNHAEFLGICTQAEMLAMYFINANKEHTYIMGNGKAYRRKGSNKGGTEWRLKHHAEKPFYHWLSTWAITMTKPSDLGYDDSGFILPPLNIHTHYAEVDYKPDDQLFFTRLKGIGDRSKVRKATIDKRAALLKNIIASDNENQWIVWTGLNKEAKTITNALPGSVEVKGSDDPDYKAKTFEDFQDGKFKILVTKPSIGGYGMNFQNANRMIFFGLNDSWETWYQAIRREWRFGQKSAVDVHVILSSVEAQILQNIKRKDAMATRLRKGLIEHTREYNEIGDIEMQNSKSNYTEKIVKEGNFIAMQGDSCLRMKELEDNSVDLSVYSPPFADLYTYTDSKHDLGNSRNSSEFFDHYKFIIREMLRVTKPGRLSCVHVSDIPAMAQKDGYIGIKDFPGDVIRAHMDEGWTFYGRAFVQKNPQAQAIRTKAKALLFVQLRKDSSDSRPALIDQILIFKKPGENEVKIEPVKNGEIDNERWIEWANGIWLGINESDTLQYTTARDGDDEKHICPLQLGTIERCIKLYSNPGETVFTPFMGIGSEAYQALKFNRKAIGIELKASYFAIAVKNLRRSDASKVDLFAWGEAQKQLEDLPLFETVDEH